MRTPLAVLLLSTLPFATLAFSAMAAGSDDTAPPATTETTTKCEKGLIWDEKTEKCLKAEDQSLNDDTRFGAVRELAYAGRPEEALVVLATMHEGDTDRVLTYLGFANRKAGRMQIGLDYYAQALKQNPDNILTRSYLGQAYIELGKTDLAQAQLDEILSRGGSGSWAEASLTEAIATGKTENY